jgi:uncharacterized protein YqiB (DUF1249 family)
VRIYHDAQVGEVVACGGRRGLHHAEYTRLHNHYTHGKWRMNRFPQKWLGYCLRQGHRFTPELNPGYSRNPQNLSRISCLLPILNFSLPCP